MAYEFKLTRQIEFSETDMAGIVHYTNVFKYMEAAEHAFFRSLGLSIHTTGFGGKLGWPRVHASCDFKRPIRFEDVIEIHLLVREKKTSSLAYTFIFRKPDNPAGEEEIARGKLAVACVRFDPETGNLGAVRIPEAIAERFDVAPAELL
ncbi:MAG: acyl-CoA thioesterase [bacterium]|nr:acyl-CoA thioesterase [bacterium]